MALLRVRDSWDIIRYALKASIAAKNIHIALGIYIILISISFLIDVS